MTITASAVNSPIEALLDRTATLVPATFTHYSASPGTWTKPAHALWVHFQLIGGGGGGGAIPTGIIGYVPGGGGGGAGQYLSVWLPAAALPSTLTCTCGAGGAGGDTTDEAGTRGAKTTIADGSTVLLEAWGGYGGASLDEEVTIPTYGTVHIARGGLSGEDSSAVGGAGAGGKDSGFSWPEDYCNGHRGRGEQGGISGLESANGAGGGGKGAGAGGGGAGSSTPGGPMSTDYTFGGGGGGGFIYSGAADATDGSGVGGAGSLGLVIITTFCGVDLR